MNFSRVVVGLLACLHGCLLQAMCDTCGQPVNKYIDASEGETMNITIPLHYNKYINGSVILRKIGTKYEVLWQCSNVYSEEPHYCQIRNRFLADRYHMKMTGNLANGTIGLTIKTSKAEDSGIYDVLISRDSRIASHICIILSFTVNVNARELEPTCVTTFSEKRSNLMLECQWVSRSTDEARILTPNSTLNQFQGHLQYGQRISRLDSNFLSSSNKVINASFDINQNLFSAITMPIYCLLHPSREICNFSLFLQPQMTKIWPNKTTAIFQCQAKNHPEIWWTEEGSPARPFSRSNHFQMSMECCVDKIMFILCGEKGSNDLMSHGVGKVIISSQFHPSFSFTAEISSDGKSKIEPMDSQNYLYTYSVLVSVAKLVLIDQPSLRISMSDSTLLNKENQAGEAIVSTETSSISLTLVSELINSPSQSELPTSEILLVVLVVSVLGLFISIGTFVSRWCISNQGNLSLSSESDMPHRTCPLEAGEIDHVGNIEMAQVSVQSVALPSRSVNDSLSQMQGENVTDVESGNGDFHLLRKTPVLPCQLPLEFTRDVCTYQDEETVWRRTEFGTLPRNACPQMGQPSDAAFIDRYGGRLGLDEHTKGSENLAICSGDNDTGTSTLPEGSYAAITHDDSLEASFPSLRSTSSSSSNQFDEYFATCDLQTDTRVDQYDDSMDLYAKPDKRKYSTGGNVGTGYLSQSN